MLTTMPPSVGENLTISASLIDDSGALHTWLRVSPLVLLIKACAVLIFGRFLLKGKLFKLSFFES